MFRLALLLGKTVSELKMSWREFSYWQAYLKIENPERAADVRTASLMAQISNMAGRALPDRKMLSAADFLGETKKTPEQSMQEQIDFMKGLGN